MEYIVVTFRSRGHTVKFFDLLRFNGIRAEIVNTPKEAGVGCGLSVKVSPNSFSVVKKLIHSSKLSSFAGFFLVKQVGNKRVVRTI